MKVTCYSIKNIGNILPKDSPEIPENTQVITKEFIPWRTMFEDKMKTED